MKITYLKLILLKITFCFVLLAIIIGCGNTYKYKDQKFSSPEDGLTAQKTDLDRLKSQITPTAKKRGGTSVVIIPTLEVFCDFGVKKTGQPKRELVEYVGKSIMAVYSNMYDCLNQRKIFDKVTLIENKYPIPMAKKMIAEYDAVIYFDIASPDQSQWFIRAAPNYENIPLALDKSKDLGYPRMLSWLNNIEFNLDKSGYIPRR